MLRTSTWGATPAQVCRCSRQRLSSKESRAGLPRRHWLRPAPSDHHRRRPAARRDRLRPRAVRDDRSGACRGGAERRGLSRAGRLGDGSRAGSGRRTRRHQHRMRTRYGRCARSARRTADSGALRVADDRAVGHSRPVDGAHPGPQPVTDRARQHRGEPVAALHREQRTLDRVGGDEAGVGRTPGRQQLRLPARCGSLHGRAGVPTGRTGRSDDQRECLLGDGREPVLLLRGDLDQLGCRVLGSGRARRSVADVRRRQHLHRCHPRRRAARARDDSDRPFRCGPHRCGRGRRHRVRACRSPPTRTSA